MSLVSITLYIGYGGTEHFTKRKSSGREAIWFTGLENIKKISYLICG
jgi:hypothetical protein